MFKSSIHKLWEPSQTERRELSKIQDHQWNPEYYFIECGASGISVNLTIVETVNHEYQGIFNTTDLKWLHRGNYVNNLN